jgi:hypothetical protein
LVTLKVQDNTIITEFYVITLGGCGIVLGMEWLRTLSPIFWDFSLMSLKYSLYGHSLLLYGLTPSLWMMATIFSNLTILETKAYG